MAGGLPADNNTANLNVEANETTSNIVGYNQKASTPLRHHDNSFIRYTTRLAITVGNAIMNTLAARRGGRLYDPRLS